MCILCDIRMIMSEVNNKLIPFRELHEAHNRTTDQVLKRTLKRAINATNPDHLMDEPNAVNDLAAGLMITKAMRNE